jgi:predicted ABC-type ATPase
LSLLPIPGRLLTDETSEAVYRAKVQPFLFKNTQRAASPRLVIVGGQPGCGKTGAVLSAARALKRGGFGVAVINGDELRPFHPDYARLVQQDRSTAADRTGPDVGAWVERAIREAADGGINSVIETTMRQPTVVSTTIGEFQRAGHQVDMHVLVVHPEVSQQSIYLRFHQALGQAAALPG